MAVGCGFVRFVGFVGTSPTAHASRGDSVRGSFCSCVSKREVIRGHQRSSEVIRGHQRPTEANRDSYCTCVSSRFVSARIVPFAVLHKALPMAQPSP